VRGDIIFEGYWKDSESTKKVLKDGWLCTGDLGYFDEHGYLYVLDRLSDMIISGGENVYPRELEKVLSTLPRISECAVVVVPDSEWGGGRNMGAFRETFYIFESVSLFKRISSTFLRKSSTDNT